VTEAALEPLPTAAEAPRPAGAAWWRTAWRQYRLERRMFWRNPSAAFFNFALPLLFLALFGAIFAGEQASLDVIVPGIAGMSVVAATFSTLAYNVTYLRERGILKRMRGTPMPSSAYLAAIGGHAVTNTLLQVGIITAAGALLFGVDWPKDWVALGVFLVAGVACFASLGVALAHLIPNFESAPAYVNAAFLPMLVISGVFYEDENAPRFLAALAELLPLKHLVDGLSGAMVDGKGLGSHWPALLALVLWGVLGAVLAIRGFTWNARRD
jgi:ABC-2 type transport system permease protein